jgi:iron(III) transport system permease protein
MIGFPQAPNRQSGYPWRWWILALVAELGLFFVAGSRIRGLLANTLWLILGTLVISIPLGTVLAILITKTQIVGRKWLQRLLVSLLLVPLYVQAAAWQAALGWGGWLPAWWAAVDPTRQGQVVWLVGWQGAIWVHAMAAVPWVALLVAVAMDSIDRELEEDAIMHGSWVRVICRVTLPQALSGVIVASLWVAAVCASEITVTDLFQIRSFAEEVYTAASLGELSDAIPEIPSSQGSQTEELADDFSLWLGTLMLGILTVTAMATLARWYRSERLSGSGWRWQPTCGRWITTWVGWGLAILLAGIPLTSMAWKAGTRVERDGDQFVRSWSATKLVSALADTPSKHRREWGWSFVCGGAVAITVTICGTWLAWALRKRWLPAVPIAILVASGFGLPGPVLGVWLIRVLNWPPDSALSFLTWCYDETLLAPMLAQTIRALPLVTFFLWTQMERVPQNLLDNAASEGAGFWRQLLYVVLPLRWPSLLAAAWLAFIIAIGELAATVLVSPPGVSTLSIRIFGLLHYGAEDQVAALCLTLWLMTGLLTVGVVKLLEVRTVR